MIIVQRTTVVFDPVKEYEQAMRWKAEHTDWRFDNMSTVGFLFWTEKIVSVDLEEQNDDTV